MPAKKLKISRQNTKSMHIAVVSNTKKGKTYVSKFLRHSYRDKDGRAQKETLACLSSLPDAITDMMSAMLKGKRVGVIDECFEIVKAKIHGPSQAVHRVMQRLDLSGLIGGKNKKYQRIILTIIGARILFPEPKAPTLRLLQDTTLPSLVGMDPTIHVNEIYHAMDWLEDRQDAIQKKLGEALFGKRDGVALYDLTSTYFEGQKCTMARRGHNRDKKSGKVQINVGLLCNAQGCPVATTVHEGNVSDTRTFMSEVFRLKKDFNVEQILVVGDRGMITGTRIKELRNIAGVGWISALKSVSIAKLIRTGHLTEFPQKQDYDWREITSDLFPDERLVACFNPDLAKKRAYTREDLLRATCRALLKIRASYKKGTLLQDDIGYAVGQVINSFKMKKHFRWYVDQATGRFRFHRTKDTIAFEKKLDGIYVIRTSTDHTLSAEECVLRYKSLAQVERAFRYLKTTRLLMRPIFHYREDRVKAHVFICMLAYFVEWHMRQAWRELTFAEEEDDDFSVFRNPVKGKSRSEVCQKKNQRKKLADGSEVHSFSTLLHSLITITFNDCKFHDSKINSDILKIKAKPDAQQKRALDLLDQKIPKMSFSKRGSGYYSA